MEKKTEGNAGGEVIPRAKREYRTDGFKLKVLKKVEELQGKGNGAVGAYLRGQGLYYSSITQWRRKLEKGTLNGKRGRVGKSKTALQKENETLKRRLGQTEKRLKKAETIIEIQKKISDMIGVKQPDWTG